MKSVNLAIFADQYVGNKTLEFLLQNYFEHIKIVVFVNEKSEIMDLVDKYNFPKSNVFMNFELNSKRFLITTSELHLDYIILAWWPYIIGKSILRIPKIGTINFHPSLLPYNRGKHYNFWTIVEDSPFGITIHFVNESIDSGDIIFQNRIEKTWEDTGESLYNKAQKAMIDLFTNNYKRLVTGDYSRIKQDKNKGSIHYGKEIDEASQIFLEKKYTAKKLINLLRARTFRPHPGCYFFDGKTKYEIRVEIKKVEYEKQ